MRSSIVLLWMLTTVLIAIGVAASRRTAPLAPVAPVSAEQIEDVAVPGTAALPMADMPCAVYSGVRFCIKDVSMDGEETHLLLESQVLDEGVRLLPRPYLPPEVEERRFFLTDDQGQTFSMQEKADAPLPFETLGDGETGHSLQSLHFAPLPPEAKSITLHIPAIVVQVPVRGTVEVDIGPKPQPGTPYRVDSLIQVGKQVIHFAHAEVFAPPGLPEGRVQLQGDVSNMDASELKTIVAPSLRLKIFSTPFDPQGEPQIMALLMGGLDEFPVRGSGFNPQTRQYELELELLGPKGNLIRTGMITVPIVGAHLLWQDLQLSWEIPSNR
ncbi:MAG: hypothetical protein ABIN58_02250 [candidate division WOR-3 bacterium]